MLSEDLADIKNILHAAEQLSERYLSSLNERPTAVAAPSVDWPNLPERGMGALSTQELFERIFLPNIVASSGPRYWGFVTGGSTPASIMGDWLTSVFDQNTQNTTGAGDCSALLEIQTVKLLLELFGLPDEFMGGCVTGATMSNFSGMAVARQWYGHQKGIDIAREGIQEKIPVYTATAHSSTIKAMSMLGMGSSNLTLVPCLPGREAMDMEALKSLLPADKNKPFIIVASGGTVNSVDFDDLSVLEAIRAEYNCWIHVDAAFGGFAACSDQFRHLLKGWEHADSITIDFHKWLNVPYDNAMIFTRKEHAALQMQTFQNSSAPYLGNPWEQFNYLNYGPENSRRFRALPVWFTLMAYGRKGYQQLVENNIRLANLFAGKLVATGYFQLAAPVRLNTVCFRIHPDHANHLQTTTLLKKLNEEGKLFMTPTVYNGEPCIRAALVNYRTTDTDIEIALNAVLDAVKQIFPSNLIKEFKAL
ncbi:pyridoxal phosphate-dependent decarboxylase family protein [Flavihumibacter stibioxidans]|uniref:Amino acid decarboxylase n=1 Tax=Flavihumibacter stibioxidans TaxID=1834163 RepID=A0ABR7MCS9_9BACT|nr:pyridoxal-dependent decarboxylase [Flavihumibacter stibioxidans]MBC6492309.1 amino acid decarboxylase [Flavihumibacter stibioxidans]